MSTLTLAATRADVLASLRRLKGRGTVGDVASDAGIANDAVREALRELLESHKGHLAVSSSGELLYEFDPRLIERNTEPLVARAWRAVGRVLRGGFKAWIVVMLVGYFALFVVLVIAALFASQRGNDSRGGWGRGRRGGHFPVPNLWFWYWVWGPRWRLGRPYYGHRWERTLGKDDKAPFYKKVFAFVFGPDRPKATQKQIDRSTIRLIRARNGVLTTAELVEHTALPFPDAETEMGRLLGAYDGEALASPFGEIVYAFPELMKSVHGDKRSRAPNPAWMRLEYPLEHTGNTRSANAVVAGMNVFTLVASASAPWFIFPRLGISGPAAYVGLVLVPVVFSALFFGIPLVRMLGVKAENRRREKRNVRRVLLSLVYSRAANGDPVEAVEAHRYLSSRLEAENVSARAVERALEELARELDADVTPTAAGGLQYTFGALPRELLAAESVRRTLALEKRELGEIVFSTSDTTEAAGARELRLFDQALAGPTDLDRHRVTTDRVAYEHDFDLVAFDEELQRQG